MGMIGKWIDTLGEKERDAIIMHPDPTYGGDRWWEAFAFDGHDCGCLVGCAMAARYNGDTPVARAEDAYPGITFAVMLAPVAYPLGFRGLPDSVEARRAGMRFPVLARRVGAPKAWAIVKARAAKGHRVTLPEPAPSHEQQAVTTA